ncbi:hypothetical protein BC829DRAFT_442985 [Chytridium lagenaria]|nr:hypothetical protein BC829DRAFT_442985 [Chytridium lagenaria]
MSTSQPQPIPHPQPAHTQGLVSNAVTKTVEFLGKVLSRTDKSLTANTTEPLDLAIVGMGVSVFGEAVIPFPVSPSPCPVQTLLTPDIISTPPPKSTSPSSISSHITPPLTLAEQIYIISVLAIEPCRWVDRYGYRPLTQTEREATCAVWRHLGTSLGIQGIPATFNDMADHVTLFEASTPTATRSHTFEHLDMLVAAALIPNWVGRVLGSRALPLAREMAKALVDPEARRGLGIPDPHPVARMACHVVLSLHKGVVRFLMMPRVVRASTGISDSHFNDPFKPFVGVICVIAVSLCNDIAVVGKPDDARIQVFDGTATTVYGCRWGMPRLTVRTPPSSESSLPDPNAVFDEGMYEGGGRSWEVLKPVGKRWEEGGRKGHGRPTVLGKMCFSPPPPVAAVPVDGKTG